MKSPLSVDAEYVKEFGIKAISDLEPLVKLGYVRSQIDEFKKVLWRNRVDAVMSELQIDIAKKDKKPEMESKFRQNLSEYRLMISQLSKGVEILEKLKDELETLVPNPTPES